MSWKPQGWEGEISSGTAALGDHRSVPEGEGQLKPSERASEVETQEELSPFAEIPNHWTSAAE